MDGPTLRDWFESPSEPNHIRYEALRAVVLDEEPAAEAAERFGLPCGTLRNWLCELRRQHARGEPPPFLFIGPAGAHRGR